MADESKRKPTVGLEMTDNTSSIDGGDEGVERRLSVSLEKDTTRSKEPNMTCKVLTLNHMSLGSGNVTDSYRPPTEIGGQLSTQDITLTPCLKTENTRESTDVLSEHQINSIQHIVSSTEDKENTSLPCTTIGPDHTQLEDSSCEGSLEEPLLTATKHDNIEDGDVEVARKAQEEGRVDVCFPGTVTPEGCCRFVSEILKCILYQRQQLPMTYDQLVYSQKKQQASMQNKEVVSWKPVQSEDMGWRKCQRTLRELEELLQQLEVLFSLSRVPRVLLLLGGTLILPKELYEINMEALVLAAGDQNLQVSSCLRQLFRRLFVADLLSDARPVHLMATTVMALAHRDCGVGWFRPKLHFKVPTRVENQMIALSTDAGICRAPRAEVSDWQDYVWFQAPMTIKGFSK